eukprot:CAMPEP_0169137126 /NCGR_PEP_ID=MMETSP1015-20121227/41334_1 /TAXON_ID=342587 /ORGANISM="Karlodinium micrum, Strain CCMP2283" /LENGTH=108 /DNA_ID=CAMNT_0009201873 /DNA_START=133 /DNA_END=459 /DNA_ORIENTATION=-
MTKASSCSKRKAPGQATYSGERLRPSCGELTTDGLRRCVFEDAETQENMQHVMSSEHVTKKRRRQQKLELIGKISEWYSIRKRDMPMALKLQSATVQQLRKHYLRLLG